MKSPRIHILVLLSFMGAFSVGAAAGEKRVLDLGEMEVDGELRRPSLQWLDSSKRAQTLLPELYKTIFAELEAELTQPLTREEYEHIQKRMELSDVGP